MINKKQIAIFVLLALQSVSLLSIPYDEMMQAIEDRSKRMRNLAEEHWNNLEKRQMKALSEHAQRTAEEDYNTLEAFRAKMLDAITEELAKRNPDINSLFKERDLGDKSAELLRRKRASYDTSALLSNLYEVDFRYAT